ncbi:hypothetical protein ACGYLV_14580 [Sulfitobacter sp. M21595]|uniref:hypothetical protein n=1 Tax=Sulfitobacter sp. M21595 TaxID=3368574 RepID=UPI003745ACFD
MSNETVLLVANNITSLSIVIACWWLAHQYARAFPPGRLIAAGFALLGFSVLITMFARNEGLSTAWLVVGSKGLIGVVLVLIAFRRHALERRVAQGKPCEFCGADPDPEALPHV